MATLNSYLQIVQKECDDTSVGGQAVMTQDIKEIYQEIMLSAYQYLIDQTYQDITATGAQNITPNAFTEINGVLYLPSGASNYKALTPMSYDYYINRCLTSTAGNPSNYLVKGTQIIFDRPVADGTFRVFYQPVVSELTDTSLIPERFNNVVKLGASYKYFAFDDNPKAVEYKAMYEEALRNMINQLSTVQKPLRPTFYGV